LGYGRTASGSAFAHRGRWGPDATNVTQANKFTMEGENRYWLHLPSVAAATNGEAGIALGRDLVRALARFPSSEYSRFGE
jgi:hypothetical protein